MAPPPIDKRALKTLMKTFWSAQGWAPESDRTPDPEEFAHARDAGYMFEPVYLGHDDIVTWVIRARGATSLEAAADAFLASLTTRRLDWRSALGSYAYAANFSAHASLHRTGWRSCTHCGAYDDANAAEDLNILSFERWKWGGVRHSDPLYVAFDLEQFANCGQPQPTADDVACLAAVVRAAEALPVEAKPGDLVKAIAGLVSSNADERRVLIEILAMSGVLSCSGRPAYLTAFIDEITVNRDRPARDHRNDWGYPAIWWRGGPGAVDRAALARCFRSVAAELAT